MDNDEQNTPRKLRWWFWPVLFVPAVFMVSAIPAADLMHIHLHGEQVWARDFVATIFVALNVGCSLLAAVHLARARPWHAVAALIILYTILFFLLNLVVSFGGCMALATTYS